MAFAPNPQAPADQFQSPNVAPANQFQTPAAPSANSINTKVATASAPPTPQVQPSMQIKPVSAAPMRNSTPAPQNPTSMQLPQSGGVPIPAQTPQPAQPGIMQDFMQNLNPAYVPQAQAQSAPPTQPPVDQTGNNTAPSQYPPDNTTGAPLVSKDYMLNLRNSQTNPQTDAQIAERIYNADSAFRTFSQSLVPLMKAQDPVNWQSDLPTYALNQFYGIDPSVTVDPNQQALIDGMQNPNPPPPPWSLGAVGNNFMNDFGAGSGVDKFMNGMTDLGKSIISPVVQTTGAIALRGFQGADWLASKMAGQEPTKLTPEQQQAVDHMTAQGIDSLPATLLTLGTFGGEGAFAKLALPTALMKGAISEMQGKGLATSSMDAVKMYALSKVMGLPLGKYGMAAVGGGLQTGNELMNGQNPLTPEGAGGIFGAAGLGYLGGKAREEGNPLGANEPTPEKPQTSTSESAGTGPINASYNKAFRPSPSSDSVPMRTAANVSKANAVTDLAANLPELGGKLPTNATEAATVQQAMLSKLGEGMQSVSKLAEDKGITVPVDGFVSSLREAASARNVPDSVRTFLNGEADRYAAGGDFKPTEALQLEKSISKQISGKSVGTTMDETTKIGALKAARDTLLQDMNHAIGEDPKMGVSGQLYSELNKAYAQQKGIQEDFNLAADKESKVGKPGMRETIVNAGSAIKTAVTGHPLQAAGKVMGSVMDMAKEADQAASVKDMFKAGKSAVDESQVPILTKLNNHLEALKGLETPVETPPAQTAPSTQYKVNDPNANLEPKSGSIARTVDVSTPQENLYNEDQIQSRLDKAHAQRTPSGEYKMIWKQTGKAVDVNGKIFKGQFLSPVTARNAFADAMRRLPKAQ